jgi:hypothetical protein
VSIHKAAPGSIADYLCGVCGQDINAIQGGQGRTYVHALTGAVAGVDPSAPEPGMNLAPVTLTPAQARTVEFYRALNVPARWFVGQPQTDATVEIVAVGNPDPDREGAAFVWSFLIDAAGVATTAEANLEPFNSGIDV